MKLKASVDASTLLFPLNRRTATGQLELTDKGLPWVSTNQYIGVRVLDDDVVRNVEAHYLVIIVTSSRRGWNLGLKNAPSNWTVSDPPVPRSTKSLSSVANGIWMNAFTMTKSSPEPVKTRLLPEARFQEQVALEFGRIH